MEKPGRHRKANILMLFLVALPTFLFFACALGDNPEFIRLS